MVRTITKILKFFRKKETRSPFELVIATITHIKDKKQLLLIPITMYSGFEQAWITGDYTKVYISYNNKISK